MVHEHFMEIHPELKKKPNRTKHDIDSVDGKWLLKCVASCAMVFRDVDGKCRGKQPLPVPNCCLDSSWEPVMRFLCAAREDGHILNLLKASQST